MHWTRIYFGMGLAAVSGIVLFYAWDEEHMPIWWLASLTVLAILLFLCSGIYARVMQKQELRGGVPSLGLAGEEERPPLLGDLLVRKYRLISTQTLQRALALQRGTKRLLGEVLLNMGEVNSADLLTALNDQRHYANGSWKQEPWATPAAAEGAAPAPAVPGCVETE